MRRGARLTLHEKTAVFSLPVSSELAENGPVEFTAQIVAPDDKVIAKQSAMLRLAKGTTRVEVALGYEFDGNVSRAMNNRIRYRISNAAEQPRFATVNGTVSMAIAATNCSNCG